MPRPPKKTSSPLADATLVVDNGAYTLKAGFASDTPNPQADCAVIPNCIARGSEGRAGKVYIADQLEGCRDFAEMAFRRPVERGYLVNWDGELDVWKQVFFNDGARLQCDPHQTNLVLTEAPNCPQALQANCDQMVFEEFEFASYYRAIGPSLNAYNDIPSLMGDEPSNVSPFECMLVVDSGYSHTTVTPLLHGRPIPSAVKRLEIGGRLLTNRLKELISLRHFGLLDEPYLVNQIKEDTCYVTSDFKTDLEMTWKGSKQRAQAIKDNIVVDYVLPDFQTTTRGHIRQHDPKAAAAKAKEGAARQTGPNEDFFPLGNERFVVPELLFNPRDLGMSQAGLPEVIVQTLSLLPQGLWPAMLANIIVIGGNANIPGFIDRLETELRPLVASDITLRVRRPKDPITYTWLGGARLSSDQDLLKRFVITKQEYDEHGPAWVARTFATCAPR